MSINMKKEAADKMAQWLAEEGVEFQRDFDDPGTIYLYDFFKNHTKKKNISHTVRLSCDLSNIPHLKNRSENPLGIEGIHVKVGINLSQRVNIGANDKFIEFVYRVCNLTNPFFKYVRTSGGGFMLMEDFVYDSNSFQHMMYKITSYADTEGFIKSEKFGRFLDECIANGYEITDQLLEEHFGIKVDRIPDNRNLN